MLSRDKRKRLVMVKRRTRISSKMGQILSFHREKKNDDYILPVSLHSLLLDGREENKQVSIQIQEEEEVEVEERWIQHYCSSHKILLVGEGDFSFSASLARAFGSSSNMVATSLDSRGFLFRNYKNAMSNIHELRTRGCKIFHGVNATELVNHSSLKGMKFDRIIYNFPHAGFSTNETSQSQKSRHQMLLSLFFNNAALMLRENGEIHVTHKSYGFFLDWNLEQLACAAGLELKEEMVFNFGDYEGYRTKYGFGGDKNFNCNPCKTYKFRIKPSEIQLQYQLVQFTM